MLCHNKDDWLHPPPLSRLGTSTARVRAVAELDGCCFVLGCEADNFWDACDDRSYFWHVIVYELFTPFQNYCNTVQLHFILPSFQSWKVRTHPYDRTLMTPIVSQGLAQGPYAVTDSVEEAHSHIWLSWLWLKWVFNAARVLAFKSGSFDVVVSGWGWRVVWMNDLGVVSGWGWRVDWMTDLVGSWWPDVVLVDIQWICWDIESAATGEGREWSSDVLSRQHTPGSINKSSSIILLSSVTLLGWSVQPNCLIRILRKNFTGRNCTGYRCRSPF